MEVWVTGDNQVIAHKGNSSQFPENTKAAVKSAIKLGCNVVEVDVSVTLDGYSVALHGPTLEKSTSGYGRITKTLWRNLHDVSTIGPDNKITSERVPLIKDLLQTFGSKTKWNLDLKSGDIEDDLIQVIKELSLQNRVVLSGLKLSNAKRILATNPNLNVVINLSRVDQAILSMRLLAGPYIKYRFRSISKEPRVVAINLHYRYASEAIIKSIKGLGLEIWVYTVDDSDLVNSLFARKVDSVTTNHPSEILQYLSISR